MQVKIEFGGGLELLFEGVKRHEVSVPATGSGGGAFTIKDLIAQIKDTMVKERPEMFIQHGTVRPGILVLVNDTDWELCGGGAYALEEGDEVTFISTLHGG